MSPRTLFRTYSLFGVLVFNVIIIFLVFNAVIEVFITDEAEKNAEKYSLQTKGWMSDFPSETIAAVYPNLSYKERKKMGDVERWVGVEFDPFFGFKSQRVVRRVLKHKYLVGSSVDDAIERLRNLDPDDYYWWAIHDTGFRMFEQDQGPWPPPPDALSVFVFGGSATAGSGVAGKQTIAGYFQDHLRNATGRDDVFVYNFGTAGHFLAQERAFMDQIMLQGFVPDAVIFVDGALEFYNFTGEPGLTPQMREWFIEGNLGMHQNNLKYHASKAFTELPVVRWLYSIVRANKKEEEKTTSSGITPDFDALMRDPNIIDDVIERYLENKKMATAVAKDMGVIPLFAWQPISLFEYNGPSSPQRFDKYLYRAKYGYQEMVKRGARAWDDPEFAWCADVQKDVEFPVYLDGAHYTEKGNEIIARCLLKSLLNLESFGHLAGNPAPSNSK